MPVLAKMREMSLKMVKAMEKPSTVEKSKPRPTLAQPCQRREEKPPEARAEPVRPATRAWLSLVGRPNFQARVLQKMMAIMAEATVIREMVSGLTMSRPMVAATAVPERVPTMLREVAMMTAVLGERTRVETTVAMELAASVQPLTNSAQRMRKRTRRRTGVTGI